jgi:uncharacterized membrane protein YedE/YeeE
MSAPLPPADTFGEASSLALAVPIGFAFGWALERAGLGSAPKLAGQFAGTDLTVFKVMFTALVTAMLGTFWLARLDWLDLTRIYVPETYVAPQIAGGLVFGVGFSMSGLCPGTSCVAASTGRADGVAVMLGLFAGILATGLTIETWSAFYEGTARGAWRLPELAHLPYSMVVTVITALALAGFLGAEWIEARTR